MTSWGEGRERTWSEQTVVHVPCGFSTLASFSLCVTKEHTHTSNIGVRVVEYIHVLHIHVHKDTTAVKERPVQQHTHTTRLTNASVKSGSPGDSFNAANRAS